MRVEVCSKEMLFEEVREKARELLRKIEPIIDLNCSGLTKIKMVVEDYFCSNSYLHTGKYSQEDVKKFYEEYIGEEFKEYEKYEEYKNEETIYGNDCNGYDLKKLEKIEETEEKIVYREIFKTRVDCQNGWYYDYNEAIYIIKALKDGIAYIYSYGNEYTRPYLVKIVYVRMKDSVSFLNLLKEKIKKRKKI